MTTKKPLYPGLLVFFIFLLSSFAHAQTAPSSAALSVTRNGSEQGLVKITFTVTLDQANNTESAINFAIAATANGSAEAGTDYADFSGYIEVEAGEQTGSLDVTVLDDDLFENDETVEAVISDPSDTDITIEAATALATITDDDNGAGTNQAAVSVTQNGSETGPASIVLRISLERANDTHESITLGLTQSAGTATPGSDYTLPASATIAAGDSYVDVELQVTDDAFFENQEDADIAVSSSSDPAVSTTGAWTTATIEDDDNGAGTNQAAISVTQNGSETGPASIVLRISLERANDTHQPITLGLTQSTGTATPGSDYTLPASATIDAGDSYVDVELQVTNDAFFENQETATIAVESSSDSAVSTTGASATATIADNDNTPGSITADLEVIDGNEEGTVAAQLQVTLSKDNDTSGAINFTLHDTGGTADAGTDYTAFDGQTISVSPGSRVGTFSIPVADDDLFENAESIAARISNPTDSAVVVNTANASGEIEDDDNDITASLSVDTPGAEADATSIVFRITLSKTNNTHHPITIHLDHTGGTATPLYDYQDFDGTIATIPDGESFDTVSVPVRNDVLFENDETVIATISECSDGGVTLSPASLTTTITDDDNAAGSISAALSVTPVAQETGETAFTYTLRLAKVNNTGQAIHFILTPEGGTARAGDDYTDFSNTSFSIDDGDTTATHTVSVIDDDLFENNETVIGTVLAVDDTDPAINITAASATTTLVDNDNGLASITASLSSPTHGNENGTDLIFRVSLSKKTTPGRRLTSLSAAPAVPLQPPGQPLTLPTSTAARYQSPTIPQPAIFIFRWSTTLSLRTRNGSVRLFTTNPILQFV